MIFVDTPKWTGLRKRKLFCHMFASSEKELHAFAEKIGRKRAWFHRSKIGSIPHYDLDEKFWLKAIEAGARERSTKECILVWRRAQRFGGKDL